MLRGNPNQPQAALAPRATTNRDKDSAIVKFAESNSDQDITRSTARADIIPAN